MSSAFGFAPRGSYTFESFSGEVELLLGEGGGRQRPLARMGAGGIFGAESVLAKEGAAADAVAVSDVRLLRYPAHALPTALQESASLRRKLLGGIARHLHEATADALDLMKGQEVIARTLNYDKVKQHLCHFLIKEKCDISSPVDLKQDGRTVGSLTSAVIDPMQEQIVGLGYVKTKYLKEDGTFEIADTNGVTALLIKKTEPR